MTTSMYGNRNIFLRFLTVGEYLKACHQDNSFETVLMIKGEGGCGRQKRKKKGIHTVLWVAFFFLRAS